jgi:zinc protease
MNRKLLLLLGVLITSVPSYAQREIEFTEFDLDNGLHVILHEDHSTPIVAVTVLYHVGSKNEMPGRTGFAHFFEHLLFEGSENIDRGEFMEIVKSNGGVLNANTTQDRTFYFELLPSNQLELGLWLESERMLHAKIDQEGLETQREVVKEEKRQNYDNQPYASFRGELFSRSFTEHPYNWIPIGSLEDINKAELSEFMDFYKTFYVPNNATLSIAGDFDPKEAKALIAKYFSDIPKGTQEIPRPDIIEPPLTAEIVDTVYDNIQIPVVFMAYGMPGETDSDAYAMQLLTQVLSGGASARLQSRFIDQEEMALSVASFPYVLEDAGIFILLGLPQIGKSLDSLIIGLDEETTRVKNELITEREYEKALNQIESSFIQSNGSMSGIAESLANYHVYYGDANLINNEIERYRSVTREDIQRVAQKYLDLEKRVKLIYLPKDQAQSSAQ